MVLVLYLDVRTQVSDTTEVTWRDTGDDGDNFAKTSKSYMYGLWDPTETSYQGLKLV